MSSRPAFDPYALFAALDRERFGYVVIGGFARVAHGSAEVTEGLDIVPSLRDESIRRLGRALEELDASEPALAERLAAREPVTVRTRAGELRIVPEPWGTRGYDDLRIRANRENLGRGARPAIASVVDCVRMLDASEREADAERLLRMRRMMELERQLLPRPRLTSSGEPSVQQLPAPIAGETQMHPRCNSAAFLQRRCYQAALEAPQRASYPGAMRHELPTGRVTFLFTDVEGSTKLLHELGAEDYARALDEHRRILRRAFRAHGGVEVDTQGDAFFVAFPRVRGAVEAAAAATEELAPGPIRVRIGIHTGTPHRAEEGYVGEDVHLGARIAASGHGGQVLLSSETRELVEAELTDLGEHRLKDFQDPVWIFQLGSERFPPLKTISNTNLPRPASSFVGRGTEVGEVVSLVQDGARLLTLTGPGGSGKTRLAIEAASELVPTFTAGVFWVGLAPLRDSALVAETIAQTLGAKDGLAEHIGGRELLLLLDNLEQVVEAAPELASLVENCPNLKLLVTSRELLRVRGEVEYPVLPLADPEAVELFCSRARMEPDTTVAELCRALDNLPLALELAAARTSVFTPIQILERLSQRLDLLKGGRDADPRQQTLRATIEWSYELLNQEERRLFTRLGIFSGGCTLEAAERVADAQLDSLQSLVEKSLVRHTDARFWMLETIRDYAVERLDESEEAEEVRRRHADCYRELAESANLMNESEGEQRFDLVIPEQSNIRAALDWACEADPDLGLRIAVALENYWAANSPAEGKRRYTTLLDLAADIPPELRGLAFRCRGGSTYIMGEFEEGARDYERALREFRRLGDGPRVGIMLFRLAIEANRVGDRSKARARLEESLELSRGHRKQEGQINSLLGQFAFEEGRHDEAFELLERSAELCRQSGFRWWEKNVLHLIADYSLMLERPAEGLAPARKGLAIAHEIADRQGIVWSLALLAWHAGQTGSGERAGRLWGAIEAEEERGGCVGQWEDERADFEERVRAGSGPEFERGRNEGLRMHLDDAVEYGLVGELVTQ